MTQNLVDRLKEAAASHPEAIAIQYKAGDGWASVTYGELEKEIEAVSAYIIKEGVRKDDKVAILLENRFEWPLIFFAVLFAGGVMIPINPEATFDEAENILKDCGAKILFLSGSSGVFHSSLLAKFHFGRKVISVDSDHFKKALETEKHGKEIKIEPSDLACILYTSGTTDRPKGVMLTHENFVANCDSIKGSDFTRPGDSGLSVLPLHHAYPLTINMLYPLLYGYRVIYPGGMRPELIMRAAAELKPTVMIGVPQLFSSLHAKINEGLNKIPFSLRVFLDLTLEALYEIRKRTGTNLAPYLLKKLYAKFGGSLRLFISGGAKLDERTEKDLFKYGFTVIEGYGLTETSPLLALNPPRRPKIGSVGPPVPGVELKIVNKDEKGVGEVIARGLNVMKGYYKRDDLTREAIKDGWFYTGDLGYLDEDGYLFLTGRSKDVIVLSSGLNIYPDEIEEVYSKRAPVKQMCVFEVPSARGDLVLWAVVVPDVKYFRDRGEVNLRGVIKERFDNVSKSLPPHKRLMGFFVTLEELPHTLLGKVKRFLVKEMYTSKIIAQRERDSEPRVLTEEDNRLLESEAGKKVIKYIRKQTGLKRPISPQDSLELDLGIDSLGRIELASVLERMFGAEIKDELIGSTFTVKDLITAVEPLLTGGGAGISEKAEEEITTTAPESWKDLLKTLPKKENLARIDLKPGVGAWLAALVFNLFAFLFFKIFYGLKVEGRENFPKTGPCILYVNHTSFFDGFLITASLPGPTRLDLFFIGFRPYFNVPIVRSLLKIGRIIPIDFATHFLEGLRSCYYVLENGRVLCIFPEGLRTLDGSIGEFQKGFGILAKEAGVKFLPAVLEGSFEAWPRTNQFPKRHPIKVKFGKVLHPRELEEEGLKMGAKDSYEAMCIAARKALVELKEEK
ncbi:MAG: AMP-binding protein [Candidatus Omnitrophica bacterium]|nr:AMP-binding protein [Candidatus Omnitrophota bacterium]